MLIPHEEIVRSVTTENPWWQTGTIPERFDRMARRAYFPPFYQLTSRWEVNRAVILLGPRREPECWQSMREFAEGKKTVSGGVFTSKTRYGRRKIANRKIDIVPAAVYCFTVGRNTSLGRSRDLLRTQFARKPAAAKEEAIA
jgi:hypothetical protein